MRVPDARPGKHVSRLTAESWRKIGYIAGAIVCLASLAFVGWTLASQAGRIREFGLLDLQLAPVLLSAAVYGLGVVSTAIAWPVLLRGVGNAPPRQLLLIGLATQMGKYLPGNLAFYIGRAALARAHAVEWSRSAGATLVEVGAAVFAGIIVGLLSLSMSDVAIGLTARYQTQLALLAAVTLALFLWFARRQGALKSILASTSILIVSFLLAGLSLYCLSYALDEAARLDLKFAIAAFAFAWVAGFVVLGAPAGIGIREVILIAMLSPIIGTYRAVVLAGVHRLVTISVDLSMGVGANYLLWRRAKPAARRG
jgi:hypothetical protein